MNMPIIVRLATKADLSNRSAAVALRDFEPLMTAVGQKLKGSDGANVFRFASESGLRFARLMSTRPSTTLADSVYAAIPPGPIVGSSGSAEAVA
jgi:hypothetical protein